MEDSDDERLLGRFGAWLREIRDEIERLEESGELSDSVDASVPADSVGFCRLVEEFTALRQELKLQTKSARGLEEQTQTLVAAVAPAIDALRSVEPKEAQAGWSAGKPLALALAELDEALERGRLQAEKVAARLAEEPRQSILSQLTEFHARQGWLSRWWHGRYHRRLESLIAEEQSQHDRRALSKALLEGYRLIQKRLAQSLADEGIARIDAAGEPVDPERMIVVDVVAAEEGIPSGLVHDEVRRGYTWKGRLLRYAEVRATRRDG